MAVVPNTKAKLAILEPTTFPSANSGDPSKAALILTNNSGKEVAKDTTVIPITIRDNLNLSDKPTDARTKYSPPTTNNTNPANM